MDLYWVFLCHKLKGKNCHSSCHSSLGVTVIGDISNVSRVAVDVIVDVLAATVGEDDGVRSLGVITVAGGDDTKGRCGPRTGSCRRSGSRP